MMENINCVSKFESPIGKRKTESIKQDTIVTGSRPVENVDAHCYFGQASPCDFSAEPSITSTKIQDTVARGQRTENAFNRTQNMVAICSRCLSAAALFKCPPVVIETIERQNSDADKTRRRCSRC